MHANKERITVESLEAIDERTLSRARSAVLLLPGNWPVQDGEPVYAAATESIYKLYTQKGLPSQPLTPLTASTHLKEERSLDWVAPGLLVSSLLLSQNPAAVTVALDITANYVTELFRGLKSDPKVKLMIVQTTDKGKSARKLQYEGPVSGLPELTRVVSEFIPEE